MRETPGASWSGMRLSSLFGLLAVGFDRIMLSHDAVACMLGRQSRAMMRMMEKCPNWNYAHICRNILPALRKGGVSDQTIRKLTVENPREYFGD